MAMRLVTSITRPTLAVSRSITVPITTLPSRTTTIPSTSTSTSITTITTTSTIGMWSWHQRNMAAASSTTPKSRDIPIPASASAANDFLAEMDDYQWEYGKTRTTGKCPFIEGEWAKPFVVGGTLILGTLVGVSTGVAAFSGRNKSPLVPLA